MTTEEWLKLAKKNLMGMLITNIRLLTPEEQESLGWENNCFVIVLKNGHCIFASSDDEGNDAGAIFTTFEDCPTLPVMG